MFDDIPLEEYFRYHPPTTEERKAKHNQVNDTCLKVARDLTQPFLSCAEVGVGMDKLIALTQLIKDETCLKWVNWSIQSVWAVVKDGGGDTEGVVMHIQQVRMFLNQGITIDELRTNLQH